jgi:hypothetical protein
MNPVIERMTVEIEKLKSNLEALQAIGQGIPALDRNLARIAASIKMLELNFVDLGSEDL